jgi:ABC-2 type transport system permease protein
MTDSAARILDRGYRRYTGPRQGTAHAVRSLAIHTLRRIMGLRRPARSKLLPLMSLAFAYVPAVVFVGIIALFNRFGDGRAMTLIPEYGDYYGFVVSAIVLFVSFAAPEALCPDRRQRMLSHYLAAPLSRVTYLSAKAIAVGTVIAGVTVGPPLLLLLGRALQNAGPRGVDDFGLLLVRVVTAGLMLVVLYSAVSLGIASLTDRRGVAAAAILFVIIGSHVLTMTIVYSLGGSEQLLALNLIVGPPEAVRRIYGLTGMPSGLDSSVLAAALTTWAALGAGTALARYRTLRVTR